MTMLGRLGRLLFGERPRDPRVFHYFDDMPMRSLRSADPVEVEAKITQVLGPDWKERVDNFKKPVPFGVVGAETEDVTAKRDADRVEILAAIDAAFDVEPYTHPRGGKPSGLTDAARFGLLDGFRRFCVDLVRLARPLSSAPSRDSPRGGNPPPPSPPDFISPGTTSNSKETADSPS